LTIVITVPRKRFVKFDKEKQLKLLQAMQLLKEVADPEYESGVKYHEHGLNDTCSVMCVAKTFQQMGYAGP